MGSGTDGISHKTDGNPNVLGLNRNDDGRNVDANWDNPDNQWNDDGTFAFLVPATNNISLLLTWGSFVFQFVLTIHQASCQFRLVVLIKQYTSLYQSILFQIVLAVIILKYPISELLDGGRAVFLIL